MWNNIKLTRWRNRLFPAWLKRLAIHAGALVSVVIVCLALWVLYDTLKGIRAADVWHHFRSLPWTSVLLAIGVTTLSYVVVTGYDVLALRHIQHPLPYARAALAGFLASAFGNTMGFALVTGGSIRYRIYSASGLTALEIAGVTALCSLTTILGMGFILAISLIFGSGELIESTLHLDETARHLLGVGMIFTLAGYMAFVTFHPITLRTSTWTLRLPAAEITMAQIVLATLDLGLVGTLIYVLLPGHGGAHYFSFLGIYALAMMAGSVSNVPGGVGVFETVLLLGLPEIEPAALLGAILFFRCVYYLTPLLLAAVLFAGYEVSLQQGRISKIQHAAVDWLDEIGPQIMGLIITFAGIVLLFSTTIPMGGRVQRLLQPVQPSAVVEIAHFLCSLSGLGLIVLARGLSRRNISAYKTTVTLLLLGTGAVMFKGLGFTEAVILLTILGILLAARREFHESGAFWEQGFSIEWLSTLTVILALTVWLGLFVYKDLPYGNELWWQFGYGYESDFSRFLRSTLSIFILTGGVTIYNLLKPLPLPDRPQLSELAKARQIIRENSNPRASLALLGDKCFLFNDAGNAFIMYRVRGKSWVALGDPVGPKDEHVKLIQNFHALAHEHNGWPVFYLVNGYNLSHYVDIGLTLFKLGEDARVPLDHLHLDSIAHSSLGVTHHNLLRAGLRCDIVNSVHVPALLPELKRISDAWLSHNRTREKSFATGYYEPNYIVNFPCALVYNKDHHLIAFAVLWVGGDSEELALDLMRYDPSAPEGVMDFLVIELLLGARYRGYRWFNLGMAPLFESEGITLTPLWQRIGRMMFRQSEHFHGVKSLRYYAEKLHPVWRTKYMALPRWINTPRILRDIAKLTLSPPTSAGG